MSGGLTRFARVWWSGGYGTAGALLRVVLSPLSGVWRVVTAIRNRRWSARGGTVVEGAWVVSVGNLAVGGTGKTPVASWAARALVETGQRPAIVTSGYGDDEIALHRAWMPDVEVVADRDRIGAARVAVDAGATAVVVDDGFQHRRLARDVDLVLLAVEDRFPGRVLPCGPYREPAASLARADGVVLTRRSAGVSEARALADRVDAAAGRPGAVLACVHLEPADLVPLTPGGAPGPVGVALDVGEVLALTAIARPDAFAADVAARTGANVELLAFRDHHDFTEADARDARARAGGRTVVVTEKDAVKLRPHAAVLGDTLVLRQRLAWDWGEDDVRALVTGRAAGAAP